MNKNERKISFIQISVIAICLISEIVLIVKSKMDFGFFSLAAAYVVFLFSMIISPYMIILFDKKRQVIASLLAGFAGAGTIILINAFSLIRESEIISLILIISSAVIIGFVFASFIIINRTENKTEKERLFFKTVQSTISLICVSALILAYPVNNAAASSGVREKALFSVVVSADVEPTNNANTKENSYVKAYLSELSPIVDGTYENLSLKEKLDLWQVIVNIESSFNGSSDAVPVKMAELESDGETCTYACFVDETETIYLNSNVFNSLSAADAMYVVLHESYHSYQYDQVEIFEAIPDEYKNLKIFDEAKQYAEGFKNYVSGSDGNMEDYKGQYVEQKANSYAYSATREYFDLINRYLSEENYK